MAWRIELLSVASLLAASGCAARISNWASAYPEGVLPVRYEPATHFSSCLAAAVAMAAGYVDDRPVSEPSVRQALREAGLDATQPGDVARWLRTQRLDMIVLAGELHDRPPVGLAWWVMTRGYPAICVINRAGDDSQYNHAVVVIGWQRDATDRPDQTDRIYYLDPSSERGLEVTDPATFRDWWARGRRSMMVVVRPPPESPDGTPVRR